MPLSPSVQLTQALLRRESVTPNDNGCQEILAERLRAAGFTCETLQYEDVTNLWAVRGQGAPLFVFAGHTDVVPTGPLDAWRFPPFDGEIKDGFLHGRGAADMKSGVACFITACERFVAANPNHKGRIGLLITSDEEGIAEHGTREVMQTLTARGEQIDMCLVGEPSCREKLGDTIKIGRRGSVNAELTIFGRQGHVAYPDESENPIHRALPALLQIRDLKWDSGNAQFPPTRLQFSNLASGVGAANVIPPALRAQFNLRFAPTTAPDEIRARVEAVLREHDLRFEIDWHVNGLPFHTPPGELARAAEQAVREVTDCAPDLSTTGGTSDGRFIAQGGAQVVEFGVVNASIHRIDECVSVADIDALSAVYERVLQKLL